MSDDAVVAKINSITESYSKNVHAINGHLSTVYDRLERLEASATMPRAAGGELRYSREDNEHKSIFLEWLRKPTDARRVSRLSEAQHELAKKDVTIASNPGGGYALPKEINSQIEFRVRMLNPFRDLVDVVQVSSNDFHSLVSMGDGTSGWSSETGTRSATATPNLRDIAPTFGELYAYPVASNWSLQDLFFDVQTWLVNDVSADWAQQEATAIISGNGTARPTGILNTAPVTTSDDASPVRLQQVIQYIPVTSAPSPLRLNIDSLIDLVGSVKERYVQESDRCAFVMHRLTLAGLRKQKASTAGMYLWEPDSQAGAPAQLLGYKVLTCDGMPLNVAGNIPVIFGNWRRGYILADRIQIHIVVDQVTTPGFTKYFLYKRLGGKIKNNDALKAVKLV